MAHENLHLAKKLRTNQTDAELKIWQALRGSQLQGCKFRRQVPLDRYIVDFVCFEHKLIIEIDGGQHAFSEPDKLRDLQLNLQGFQVLRFWNNDVMNNLMSVLQRILESLNGVNTPHPSPLPQGERGSQLL